MPTLVTLDDLKAHLGDTSSLDFATRSGANEYLTDVLDRVEDMLERATNRTFHTSGTATDEPQDGTGFKWVYVDRPIDILTEIKIGYDPNDPDNTLSTFPDDAQAVEKRKIVRRDTGVFPSGTSNVYVTYDHLAFTPEVAQQAVVEGATFMLRRRGSEHSAAKTIGEFGNVQYAARFSKLPAWQKAVGQLERKVMA